MSPKDLERSRRDVDAQVFEYDHISPDSILPSNWGTFLSVRKHKKLFANFISDQFSALANLKFPKLECFFVTAGGFDNEFKGQARCAFGNFSAEYIVAAGDHEEADTRMWLHAITSTAQTVCIHSPDTDVHYIGLPILKNTNLHEKSVYVQLKDSPDEKICIDMNQFVSDLRNDICL